MRRVGAQRAQKYSRKSQNTIEFDAIKRPEQKNNPFDRAKSTRTDSHKLEMLREVTHTKKMPSIWHKMLMT